MAGQVAGRVAVGRIIRPQGNRGQVVVVAETDFPEARFAPGEAFDVEVGGAPRRLVVTDSRPHDARWVVSFEGIASIDDAETLRGVVLDVPEAALTPLGAGQYYLHDLERCRVETGDGQPVGPVSRVEMATGTPLLVVIDAAGHEVLVPLAEPIVQSVDIAAERIVIVPPAGLLGLNTPGAMKGRRGED